MLFDSNLFVGVDSSGGRKPFTYAAFNHDAKLVALNAGEMEDVLTFISGQPGMVLAINSAPQPSLGLLRQGEIRQSLPPLHISGRSLDMRISEHILRQHGINVSMTPARREQCSTWAQMGFEFYRWIEKLGFKPSPETESGYQWIETHPHASFCTLLGQIPLSRTTLEGRLQRQLVLYEQGLLIRDPMDFFEEITRHKLLRGILPLDQIYGVEELDAISAAYVAYVAGRHPERVMKIGDPQEGQITMPVLQLKPKYE